MLLLSLPFLALPAPWPSPGSIHLSTSLTIVDSWEQGQLVQATVTARRGTE